jgi:hypothetical protein
MRLRDDALNGSPPQVLRTYLKNASYQAGQILYPGARRLLAQGPAIKRPMVATSPMRRALTMLALLPAFGALALGCRMQARTGAATSSGAAATRTSGEASPPLASRETCFILREVGGPRQIRKGDAACARRLPPASTFKIPHALIALETGARSGPDDLEQWDGTDRGLAVWNRDQTLGSAIQHSVVWYFQRTATRVGRDQMTKYLARIHYGNAIVGADITRFWLDGSLQITADEQADFMVYRLALCAGGRLALGSGEVVAAPALARVG